MDRRIGNAGGNDMLDLVDLEILGHDEAIDVSPIDTTARRRFASLRNHAWPLTVVAHDRWETIGLEVIDTVTNAVVWVSESIDRTLG
ncbi:hypothetical protein BH24ACT5_BH24ACT5_02730 [soil metagenome]